MVSRVTTMRRGMRNDETAVRPFPSSILVAENFDHKEYVFYLNFDSIFIAFYQNSTVPFIAISVNLSFN